MVCDVILRGGKDDTSDVIRNAHAGDTSGQFNDLLLGLRETDGDQAVFCWFSHFVDILLPKMFDRLCHAT